MKVIERFFTMFQLLCILFFARPVAADAVMQPAISLDFAQYCIGDSWKFRLSNGVPNTPVRLLGNSNGQSWEISDWGTTDADGNFIAEGTFAEGAAGSHSLQVDVAETLSNTIYFVVSECSVKGSRIAFVSTRDGGVAAAGPGSVPNIYVANADGSGVTRLTQGEMPTWSADGQRLAFYSTRIGWPEIRVIDADGSNERVLGRGMWPSWSPDGTRIVFFSATGGSEGGIFMMNADGTGVTQLISNEFANPGYGDYAVELPSWSPDGRSIAFVRANYEDPWTVHILDLATSDTSLVNVGTTVGDSRPAWSPDGTRLLLQVPFWAIASVNRDGSGFQKHVEATYVGTPDWSPDGKSIVFEKFTGPGDQTSPAGSRMRIFVASLEDGSVRQLIPEAVAPALLGYWDSEPAWSRVRQSRDYVDVDGALQTMFPSASWTVSLNSVCIEVPMSIRSNLKVAILLITFAVVASGQVPTGVIAGVARDPSGAALLGANVNVTSQGTGFSRSAATSERGEFSFSALLPGDYEVSLEAPGFQRLVRHVTVEAGTTTTTDVEPPIGPVTESIAVGEAVPQIHYDSHTVSGVVTQKQIEGLLLNGRSYLELAKLEPGVQPPSRASSNRTLVPLLGSPGGTNGRGTRVTVDGGSVMSIGNGGSSLGLSQEAVQEFQVSTVNFDLSTGPTFSGAINVVTRSGNNDLHGSAFYYFRDHNLSAYRSSSQIF